MDALARERTQQLMADPLFEVANHTWEHRNLRVVSGQKLADEIGNTQLAYEQVRQELEAKQCSAAGASMLAHEQAPKRLSLMRFPYGACSAVNEVARQGLLPIQWDVSSGDPTVGQSARAIERQVLGNVLPGSIVLFHANGRGWHTDAALPAIIAELKAQGYEFATVSELLAAGEPVLAATCYDSRPGDTDRWPLRPSTTMGDQVASGFAWPWSAVSLSRTQASSRPR
jgi:peptidoglycan-N-acetylglucosamine deacetylase